MQRRETETVTTLQRSVERRAVPLPDQLRALRAAKHRYQQRAPIISNGQCTLMRDQRR